VGKTAQNYIDHIVLLLDASSSMQHLQAKTIEMADGLVKFLAEESKKSGEETRVSIYSFADEPVCLVWDMDVVRLPSLKEHYNVYGWTALIDAVTLALDDAELITEKYGKHDFTFHVLTDGEDNRSKGTGRLPTYGRVPKPVLAQQMKDRLARLAENRSVAILVPNDDGVAEAVSFGFAPGNISVWDATSERGLEQAVDKIKTATIDYRTTRTQTGLRGTNSLFVGGNVNAAAIKDANLTPLPTSDRQIVIVTKTKDAFEKVVKRVTKSRLKPEMGWFVEIEKFVNLAHPPFRVGKAYYELVKPETIQGDKEIAVVDVNTNKAYVGSGARQLLGLPEERRRVKPEENGQYKIYVQSSSLNRHLPIGSHVLMLTM